MVTKSKTGQVVLNIVFIILAVWAVAPFLLLISSSLSSEAALAQYGYGFWPKEFSLNAYTYLFKSSMKIAKGYGITLIVTLVGTTLSVLITTMFAYPLSRKELPFRYGFSFFVFFTMLFNGGLVPSYMMWTQTFHIKNTIWALIMPNLLLNAFYVIMMRSFFTASIPDALIEAARIDGAGEYKILARVVIPLSKPMMATISLMVGLGYWNDWTNSLYYIHRRGPVQYPGDPEHHHHEHSVPDQRPEFGHFCGGCFQASQRQYPYGDRSHRRSSDPLHLPVLPEILCQRYRGRRCERLIQKFEKTVVVFKKSLYNRVVAKAATLFVYNSSEHKQNEKTGYANWFAIGWIVIL